MSKNSETFRNELISRLLDYIPNNQLVSILSAIDTTIAGYDIKNKQLNLIPLNGIPEVVKTFIASKAIKNLSEGTLKIYKLRLFDFFEKIQKPFQDINANDIRMYLGYYKIQKHSADSYLDNMRRILNSFFSWLVSNAYLLRNPCATVEHVKHQSTKREPLTFYELEVLRWNCKTLREKAMVDFFFSTGVRLSEFSNTLKSDINLDKRSVNIRHGKGNKQRIVFFNAESELSLRKYLESRTDDNTALFVTMRRPHNKLGPKAIENEIAKIAKRANLHVFPHKLRHTFATSGLHGGIALENLQALMGHTKPETTMIYAKINMAQLQMEHDRIYT